MDAAKMARDSLCAYTHVKPGFRTIVDALNPFVETFTEPTVTCLVRDYIYTDQQPTIIQAAFFKECLFMYFRVLMTADSSKL